MTEKHVTKIAQELQLTEKQVRVVLLLLEEGATVPFVARYRKEATGGLDEVKIISIRDRAEQLGTLDKRRETVLKSLEEQGKLTDELKKKVLSAETLAVLEDIYLPYRPKRRTRGMAARERGLEPLAAKIFEQSDIDPEAEASAFVDPEKGVEKIDDALAGARDIIAEWINEDAGVRAALRELFAKKAAIHSKVAKNKEEEGAKYRDYFDWEEPVAKAPSHRVLAIRRGAAEGFLIFRVLPDEKRTVDILERHFVKGDNPASQEVRLAVRDSYKRLLSLSMETETRLESKNRADGEAIRVFAQNIRNLLLTSPLGQKRVLAIDPGLRTGCKVVCLDPQGKLLHNDTIFPLQPRGRVKESEETLKRLAENFSIEVVAIGNGTGGRETEEFCRGIDFGRNIAVVMVSESGASVYSASEVAREEFPDYDLTVRGAVSIGRRLMDPLSELVKIDPKAIGVGQYQHDVDQKALKKSLDDVVTSCVNAVGVEVNTASKQLLSYVSGLSEKLAGNIISCRNEKGAFSSRAELMKVQGMGAKTFEQAAGFLRIHGAENLLDASAVHPESYPVIETMAGDLGCSISDLMTSAELREKIILENYVSDTTGMPTLTDIMMELAKPGRDPREQFELFTFTEGVSKMADLEVGMKLPGIVTNVTDFGAFVDIGVHQDGLVHISALANRFVRNPHDVIKVNQKVSVTVMDVDIKRNRISLSMRSNPMEPHGRRDKNTTPGEKKAGNKPARRETGGKTKTSGNPFTDALKEWKSE
ncbi:MAG: RNA-binding transcriptional accessory protein [Deltaproteobacteria bacterium]|nr:RNA-binding transcriptional accessory protein [Deltaproteobacteria bacterium]